MSLLLNTGAMHYRENVNDDWKPLVIKANADLTVLADEYSNASTYVVGEYCRYDGQLYRCTTAIATAESWTPAHWTETNIGDELESINDELESINDSYLPLTAGANKPLTGNLNIYRADDSPGLILKNGLADMSGTESATRVWFLYCQDKDGDLAGFLSANHTATGRGSIAIAASNISNGSAVSNALELRMERDGTRSVAVTSVSAWRSALGLGTSGNLPLTIEQGGTGSTQITDTTGVSSIITPASGITVSNAHFQQWGKVGTLYLELKSSSAITANGVNVGTLVTGKRPSYVTSLPIATPAVAGAVTIGGSGIITVRAAISANVGFVICGTFLIA